MDKKELKMYEAPSSEVMELEVQSALLAGSTNADNVDIEGGIDGGDL